MSYTYEHLQDKTFGELKRIAQQLNVLPAGDRRFRQNWIDPIAGVNPPLLQLLELESVVEAIEPKSKFDCAAYPKPATKSIAQVKQFDAEEFWLTHAIEIESYIKSFTEADRPSNRGDNDRDRFEVEQKVSQSAIAPAVIKTSTAHQLLQRLKLFVHVVEDSPTLSDSFLARYSVPTFENIHFLPDANGQLSLLEFEVELAEEPPDPDDYSTEFEFRAVYDAWCDRNPDIDAPEFSEPLVESLKFIEPDLASMSQWAPCPDEWYEPVIASEDANRCPCGVVFAVQCDGTTATHFFDDCIYTVSCHRHFFCCSIVARFPLPKSFSFLPMASQPQVNHNQTYFYCIPIASNQLARSPPGGDFMR